MGQIWLGGIRRLEMTVRMDARTSDLGSVALSAPEPEELLALSRFGVPTVTYRQ